MIAAVASRAHNPKVGGSIPSLATKQKKVYKRFGKSKKYTYLCKTIKKTFFELKILSVQETQKCR